MRYKIKTQVHVKYKIILRTNWQKNIKPIFNMVNITHIRQENSGWQEQLQAENS